MEEIIVGRINECWSCIVLIRNAMNDTDNVTAKDGACIDGLQLGRKVLDLLASKFDHLRVIA